MSGGDYCARCGGNVTHVAIYRKRFGRGKSRGTTKIVERLCGACARHLKRKHRDAVTVSELKALKQ